MWCTITDELKGMGISSIVLFGGISLGADVILDEEYTLGDIELSMFVLLVAGGMEPTLKTVVLGITTALVYVEMVDSASVWVWVSSEEYALVGAAIGVAMGILEAVAAADSMDVVIM